MRLENYCFDEIYENDFDLNSRSSNLLDVNVNEQIVELPVFDDCRAVGYFVSDSETKNIFDEGIYHNENRVPMEHINFEEDSKIASIVNSAREYLNGSWPRSYYNNELVLLQYPLQAELSGMHGSYNYIFDSLASTERRYRNTRYKIPSHFVQGKINLNTADIEMNPNFDLNHPDIQKAVERFAKNYQQKLLQAIR